MFHSIFTGDLNIQFKMKKKIVCFFFFIISIVGNKNKFQSTKYQGRGKQSKTFHFRKVENECLSSQRFTNIFWTMIRFSFECDN